MTSTYPLLSLSLFVLYACGGRPAATTDTKVARDPIVTPEVETEAAIACDGTLTFKLSMYYGPHLQEDTLLFAAGALQFSSPNEAGATELCEKTLDPKQVQNFSGAFAELNLQDFPEMVNAPFVRDGTTLVLKAICGDKMIKLKARNVFPLPIRNLLDRVNAMVAAAGCNDDFRFPDGKSLKLNSDNMGVTEMCADDCKACNTCSFQ